MRGYRETEQIGAGAAAEDRDCVAGCGKAPATSDGRSQYQYVTQQPLPLWQTLPCIFILGHVTYILPILGLHLATLATMGWMIAICHSAGHQAAFIYLHCQCWPPNQQTRVGYMDRFLCKAVP